MDDIDLIAHKRAITFLRILGWMLGTAMLINGAVASFAYGPSNVPAYLFLGGIFLLGGLAYTSPRFRRWTK